MYLCKTQNVGLNLFKLNVLVNYLEQNITQYDHLPHRNRQL